MKSTYSPVSTVRPKLIQMLPWMTSVSRMGMPIDRNVNSSTSMTMRMDKALTMTLSCVNVCSDP